MASIGTTRSSARIICCSLFLTFIAVCTSGFAHANATKDWTFIIYMAADNDLKGFAARNIRQMMAIGSNEHINIVVHLDITIGGKKKITRRYYIEKNKPIHVNADDESSQAMDSGDVNTLVSCCKWAIGDYPARHYALVFWNHGTGYIDPFGKTFGAVDLFTFNPAIKKLELDRSIGFLDFITKINEQNTHIKSPQEDSINVTSWDNLITAMSEDEGAQTRTPDNLLNVALMHKLIVGVSHQILDQTPGKDRGICWDDTTGNYLTNQKLTAALQEIQTTLLGGRKFDIIGFDACLMAMLEVASLAKKYAHIMVGSEEVELGAGWNYQLVLSPFIEHTMTPVDLAKHIVQVFKTTFNRITDDYTQSAIDLDNIDKLENNVAIIADLLIEGLKRQKNGSVKRAIQISKDKQMCTYFDEQTYKDLYHFLSNLQLNIKHFNLTNEQEEQKLKAALAQVIEDTKNIITQIVFANVAGKNLSQAKGISIYFPEYKIHQSYRKSTFAANNSWGTLLNYYINT